jgi:hypothetical protein
MRCKHIDTTSNLLSLNASKHTSVFAESARETASLTWCDQSACTLAAPAESLLQACLKGQLAEALQAVHDLGDNAALRRAAANAVGPGGWTPLLAAARLGGVQLVEALVGVGY